MYAVWSMCLCVCEHVHTQPCPWRPEEGTGFSGAGITQSCELPHMGAGTQSVCWKNKQQSLPLSRHSGFIYVCMYVYKMYMLVQFLVGSSCTKLTFSQTKRQHTIPPHPPFFYLLGARNASFAQTLDLWSHGGIIGRIQPHPERLYFDNMFPLSFDISALFIHSGLGVAVSHTIPFSGGACWYKLTKHTLSLAIVISSEWHKQVNHSQVSQRTTQQNWFSTQQFSFLLVQIPAAMALGLTPRYIPTLSALQWRATPCGTLPGSDVSQEVKVTRKWNLLVAYQSVSLFGSLLR